MKTLLSDVLKVGGKWSLKRIFSSIAMLHVSFISTFIIVSDYFLQREINRYSIEVLELLIFFTAGSVGITEFSKKFHNRSPKKDE